MSAVYKLDARVKLLGVLEFSILVFLVDNLFIALFLLIIFFVIRQFFKIPAMINLKSLTLLAAFIILLQSLFGPGENFIVKPLFPDSLPVIGGIGSLKWDGLLLGLVVVCRVFALIIIFSIFTETTSPNSLAVGLTSLGFSYVSAFVITTTFNLIPFFREEALIIMDAQKLRGKRFNFASYSGLALPLVLGAMRKAQISSVVMDSRAFGVYDKRTWLEKPQMKVKDFVFLFSCIVFCAGVLFLNYFLKRD